MLSDLIAYAPLVSMFLVTGLRMIFDKPRRLDIPFLRARPTPAEEKPESSSIGA